MQKINLIIFLMIMAFLTRAQQEIPLWETEYPPYYKENNLKEYTEPLWGTKCVYNITRPTLTIYPAKGENSGKAVLIFPGGGYEVVAIQHEGHDVAKVLSENGITAAVVKYRLPLAESSDKPWLVPTSDAQQALKIIRSKADELGFKMNMVGAIGFSAGAHLVAYSASKTENKPDFTLPIYGCPRLNEENIAWLEKSLFNRKMTKEELADFNIIEKVNRNTPTAFLVHSIDDETCHYLETTLYAEALLKAGVPVEVHLFPKGGHGFGLGREEDGTSQWIYLAINWIKRL
jgi:acetyl esterase/lipase